MRGELRSVERNASARNDNNVLGIPVQRATVDLRVAEGLASPFAQVLYLPFGRQEFEPCREGHLEVRLADGTEQIISIADGVAAVDSRAVTIRRARIGGSIAGRVHVDPEHSVVFALADEGFILRDPNEAHELVRESSDLDRAPVEFFTLELRPDSGYNPLLPFPEDIVQRIEPVRLGRSDYFLRNFPSRPLRSIFARRSGFGWYRIDAASLGPQSIAVLSWSNGGTVFFDVEVPASLPRTRLVVRDSDQRVVFRMLATDSRLQGFGSWPEGAYSAYLAGTSGLSSLTAISPVVSFEVTAGATVTVDLKPLLAEGDREMGRLSGLLSFDSWELVEVWHQSYGIELRILPRDLDSELALRMLPRSKREVILRDLDMGGSTTGGSPTWAWDLGEFPPGEYRLSLDPLHASIDFAVIRGERTHLATPIADLAIVYLDVRDGTARVVPESVLVVPVHPGRETGAPGVLENAKTILAEDGTLAVVTTPGNVAINIRHQGLPYGGLFEVLPGFNHERIEIRP